MAGRWPFDRRDALGLAGFGALLYGVSLLSVPAAWICAGVLLLGAWARPWLRQGGKHG